MHDRIGKSEIVEQLARRMSTNEQVASEWLEATLETLYGVFKQGDRGDSVPLAAPVLLPLTPEAEESIQGKEIKLEPFPFRVGRSNFWLENCSESEP